MGTLLLWASAFVAIRAIGDTFGPGPMALLRLVAGSLTLTVFVLVRAARPVPRRAGPGAARLLIAGYGVLWFAGYTVALNAAERHLDAGTAAMLVNVAPILVAVVAGRLLGEGYPRPLLIGIVVSFTGVAVIADRRARASRRPARGAARAGHGRAVRGRGADPEDHPAQHRRADRHLAGLPGGHRGAAAVRRPGAGRAGRAPWSASPPWSTWGSSRPPSASRSGPTR